MPCKGTDPENEVISTITEKQETMSISMDFRDQTTRCKVWPGLDLIWTECCVEVLWTMGGKYTGWLSGKKMNTCWDGELETNRREEAGLMRGSAGKCAYIWSLAALWNSQKPYKGAKRTKSIKLFSDLHAHRMANNASTYIMYTYTWIIFKFRN